MLQASRYRWKLTQWDYGQVLQICGMEVEEEQIQVHFTDKCTNGALVVLGKVEDGDITVDIPNELLKRSGTIQAYVYKTIPGEGKTIFEIRLSVKARKSQKIMKLQRINMHWNRSWSS